MIWSMIRGDIKFQYKYGFYFLYMFFTIVYISLIYTFPSAWREKSAILMIFTDPSAMGLYFMGAIVLFEKSERVLDSLIVSPALPHDYVISKLISIRIISVIVSILIGFFSKTVSISFNFIIGIFLSSCLFSSVGLIVASKSKSLNNFIISTVPAQLLIFIPAIAWLFGFRHTWMMFHPGVCVIELCENGNYSFIALIVLLLWTLITLFTAEHEIKIMFKKLGGIKL